MIAWLWNIIIGQFCRHQWKILGMNEVHEDGAKIGDKYHLQCIKCGDVKFKRSYYV